jgi:hypothetical protein
MLGILLGHYLTRSWQREQARADNVKQEYRELLKALAEAYTTYIRLGAGEQSPEDQIAVQEARANSISTFHDRIYIARRLDEKKLMFAWIGMVASFERDLERMEFTNRFTDFQDRIRAMAIEDTK